MRSPKPWGGHALIAVLLALFGVAVLAGFWFENSVERHLKARGVSAVGTVLNTGWEWARIDRKDNRKRYYVNVAFPVNGGDRQERFQVSQYHPYRAGSPIKVLYDPQKPSVNRLQEDVEHGSSWGLLAFAIALLGGSVFFVAWAYRIAHKPPEPSDVPSIEEALAKARRH